jgi:hypothetical protein
MSLENIVDTNMNEIPPPGVTVIISNDAVTVTNHEATTEDTQTQTDTQTEEPETEYPVRTSYLRRNLPPGSELSEHPGILLSIILAIILPTAGALGLIVVVLTICE